MRSSARPLSVFFRRLVRTPRVHQGILACMKLWRRDANTAGALLVMYAVLVVGSSTIQAQTSTSPAKRQGNNFQALLLDATYSKPLRSNFGASLFLSDQNVKNSEGGSGLIVGGSVGPGGMQVWGGRAVLGLANTDVRGVVTRTWNSPRGASANSTYVGGEFGCGQGFRLSLGYAKRVSGPSTGNGHIVTWGVGLEIPIWR